jgi:quercetin dioxygenase-like cupin family protein
VIVTSGVLRVGPAEAPFELGPGDYVSFLAQRPHSYQTVDGPVTSVLVLEYPADAGPPALGGAHGDLGTNGAGARA